MNDPAGWMEFTFRPDHRYIAQSGTEGVPNQVERGRYVVGADKVTLAPYAGLGESRGFELDLYDGDLFLSEWAAERKPIPCEAPGSPNASLMNTGISLSTHIEPDDIPDSGTIAIRLAGSLSGNLTISGAIGAAGSLVTERATSLAAPINWQTIQTNNVPSGPFSFPIPMDANAATPVPPKRSWRGAGTGYRPHLAIGGAQRRLAPVRDCE